MGMEYIRLEPHPLIQSGKGKRNDFSLKSECFWEPLTVKNLCAEMKA